MFRAFDPEGDRTVALKSFPLDLTPEQAAEFAEALAHLPSLDLDHPSLIVPIAAGAEGSTAYLVEDYFVADSLDTAVRQYGPAPVPDALRLVGQLAGALDFAAAAGVHHGALHPRDILVAPREVRLTGIGVAAALEAAGGRTPVRRPYSAPERVARAEWGAAADVFSLAAVAHELLTGRRPASDGETARADVEAMAVDDKVGLDEVFSRAFAVRPEDRFPAALAFAAALKHALTGQLIDAAAEPGRARSRRSSRSGARRAVAGLPLEEGGLAAAVDEEHQPAADRPIEPDEAGTAEAHPDQPPSRPVHGEPAAVAVPIESLSASPADETVVHEAAPTTERTDAGVLAPAGPPPGEPDLPLAQPLAPEPPDMPLTQPLATEPDMPLSQRPPAEPDLPAPAPIALDDLDLPEHEREPSIDTDRALDALDARRAPEPERAPEPRPGPELEPRPEPEPGPDRESLAAAPLFESRPPRRMPGTPSVQPPLDLSASAAARPERPSVAEDERPMRRSPAGRGGIAPPPAPDRSARRVSALGLVVMLVVGVSLGLLAGYYFAGRRAAAPAPASESPAQNQASPSTPPTPVPAEPLVPTPSGSVGGATAAAAPGSGPAASKPAPARTEASGGRSAGGGAVPEARPRAATPPSADSVRPGRGEATTPRTARAPKAKPAPSRPAPRGAAAAERARGPVFQGALAVASKPSGARVLVDGHVVGTTPMTLPAVPAGSHVIRLERDGYMPWSSGIQVVAGQQNRVTASLEQRASRTR